MPFDARIASIENAAEIRRSLKDDIGIGEDLNTLYLGNYAIYDNS